MEERYFEVTSNEDQSVKVYWYEWSIYDLGYAKSHALKPATLQVVFSLSIGD